MLYNRTFRVFVSSTFEDFQTERELLRNLVWPELESFCKLRGATFEAIDLRWGIPADSAEDLDIVTICLDEVERCRELSPRPNFIAMIGNRYGWRPLPATIPIGVFKALPTETKKLIEEHYHPDYNAVPAVYLINKATFDDKSTASEQENALLMKIRLSLNKIKRTSQLEDLFFKSATHLEIDKGILKTESEETSDHFFACFRHIEELSGKVNPGEISPFVRKYIDVVDNKDDGTLRHDPDAAYWLENLGKIISLKLKNNPGQLGNYQTTLDELSNHQYNNQNNEQNNEQNNVQNNRQAPPYAHNMCRDIEKWLKKVIGEELDTFEKIDSLQIECLEHEKFKVQRTTTFGGRGKLRSELKNVFKNHPDTNVICIHGEGGSGKSALMAKIIDDVEKDFAGSNIIYRFIGAAANSVELNSLIEGIVDQVNDLYRLPQETARVTRVTRKEHVDAFNNCLTSSLLQKRVFIFIDALDQLNNFENEHSLYWLPQTLSKNVTLVLSALNGPVKEAVQRIYPKAKCIDISPGSSSLESGEAEAMLNALLQRKPARTLQNPQINYILENFNKNPLLLYLKLMVENARHWHSNDSIETIEEKNTGIKETLDEQIELLFKRLSQKDNYGPLFVKHVLSLIALAREGVSAKEIAGVLWKDDAYRKEFEERKHANQPDVDGLPPIVWSRFFFEIEPFIMERNAGGTIVFDFFHRRFKEVVKKNVSTGISPMIHRLLATYFSDKEQHPIRFISQDGSVVYNARKLIELPYHQVSAGLAKRSYTTLTDFVFIESKAKIGKAYELMEDFERAVKHDIKNEFPLVHLIAKALRANVNFIARHPDCLFQSLYNSCWWYDHPGKNDYYGSNSNNNSNISSNISSNAQSDDHSNAKHPGPGKADEKLYALMESWKNTKSALEPGFRWLRALRPPAVPLDGPQQSVLIGLSSPVIYVRYSPDGDKIYAVSNTGEFIAWNAVDQNIEQYIPLPHEKSFMFRPNSKFTFDADTEILSEKGGVIADHEGAEYWAWPGTISRDGEQVLGGSIDGTITLWRFSNRKNEKIILETPDKILPGRKPPKRPARGMAFSNNNKLAAAGHADGTLVIWDLTKNKSLAAFKHQDGWVNGIAMSDNGEAIVSGGGDGSLYAWKKNTNAAGQETGQYNLTELKGHSDRIWCVAVSSDGRLAASGSDDKSVRLWDLQENKEIKCLKGHSRWVQAVVFDKTAGTLASSSGDGKIMLWDVKGDNLEAVKQFEGHDDSVLSLYFSDDGKKLLSGSRDHSVRIWDTATAYSNVRQEGHTDRISSTCFSRDGLTLITGSHDHTVRLWNADSGEPAEPVLQIGASVSALQVSPDNSSIWVGCEDGSIETWSLATHAHLRRMNAHTERIYSVDISGDSKLVATASQDGNLKLWRLKTLEKILDITIKDESILSVAFSVDGTKLAAGMRSGTIVLWETDARTGWTFDLKELCRKKLFKAWADELSFSKDGNQIEARGGSWGNRNIIVLNGNNLSLVDSSVDSTDEKIRDGAAGSFGRYRLGFGSAETSVKNHNDQKEIAWYPARLEFAAIHPQNRQWAGVQRYNLHHFRLEGGV